jgi:hypothetical protein
LIHDIAHLFGSLLGIHHYLGLLSHVNDQTHGIFDVSQEAASKQHILNVRINDESILGKVEIAIPFIERLMGWIADKAAREISRCLQGRQTILRKDKALFEICLAVKIHGIYIHYVFPSCCMQ